MLIKIFYAKVIIAKCLIFLCGFLSSVCFPQILNESFEINNQPTLDNWIIKCENGESFKDAPADGGSWCLRLPEGNLQGCYPETAIQIISGFNEGIWKVSVWAKQYKKKLSKTSLYLKVFNERQKVTTYSVDTTSSKNWTLLTVIDTVYHEKGNIVSIVLEAGITSGPQLIESYSYFDLVKAEKLDK